MNKHQHYKVWKYSTLLTQTRKLAREDEKWKSNISYIRLQLCEALVFITCHFVAYVLLWISCTISSIFIGSFSNFLFSRSLKIYVYCSDDAVKFKVKLSLTLCLLKVLCQENISDFRWFIPVVCTVTSIKMLYKSNTTIMYYYYYYYYYVESLGIFSVVPYDKTMCPEVDWASENEYQGFLLG